MRSFLLAPLAVFAGSVVASVGKTDHRMIAKRTTPGINDIEILNYALTLEYLERDFYAAGLAKFSKKDFKKAGFSSTVYDRLVSIASQEATHVSYLATALGSAAVGECKYMFPLTDVATFLKISLILEGVGTAAYLGAAPDISESAYLAAAGSILTIEARHSSFLNEVNGISGFPTPFESALTYSEVYTLASQFIVPGSCGSSGTLPPGIHAYPALTIKSAHPASGHYCGFHFALKKGAVRYWAVFINGGQTLFSPLNDRGVALIPKGLTGVTYVLTTSSGVKIDDSTIAAGPNILFL
ncbi:hypothetical protein T439DRAFT_380587 [Meredithblackwellia eburnea MCA 4105]